MRLDPLPQALRSDYESIAQRYAHGECGPFAIACARDQRHNGWALVVFVTGDEQVIHAACEVPEGGYFDAYGFVTLGDIRDRYGKDVDSEWADEDMVKAALDHGDEDAIAEADDHLQDLVRLLEKMGKACHSGSAWIRPEADEKANLEDEERRMIP